jgi:hypothetical protein
MFSQRRQDLFPGFSVRADFLRVHAEDISPFIDNDFLNLKRAGVFAGFSLSNDFFVTAVIQQPWLKIRVSPHPDAQNIMDLVIFQLLDSIAADHSPVGHNACPPDPEPVLKPKDCHLKALHIGRVSRPQLAAQRISFAVQDNARDHLLQIRPMVLRMPVLSYRLADVAFKIDRPRVKERQIQPRKQILPQLYQAFTTPAYSPAWLGMVLEEW